MPVWLPRVLHVEPSPVAPRACPADLTVAARQPTFGSPAALNTPSMAGLATRR
jgi:hypothetical protein